MSVLDEGIDLEEIGINEDVRPAARYHDSAASIFSIAADSVFDVEHTL